MKNKTNLINIISSKQTNYNKIILEDKRLTEFNICIQNCLHTSKIDFDKDIYKNIILIVYSSNDELDSIKNIEKILQNCTTRTNNIPTFIIIENNTEDDIVDIMTVFATYGFVPVAWGGDIDFIKEEDLIDSLYLYYFYS